MLQFYRRLQAPRVISFDLDDTLYDNAPIMARAEQQVHDWLVQRLPQAGAWSLEQWRERRSHLLASDPGLAANMTLLRHATLLQGFKELGIADAQRWADDTVSEFIHQRSQIDVAPEVLAGLKALGQAFHVVAISNGNADIPKTVLHDRFEHVWQPTRRLRGKPYSDLFEQAQAQYPQFTAQQFLHVGDHPISDVFGAQRTGWQSAWYRGGLGKPEQLQVLPTLSYSDFSQLLNVLIK